MSQLDIECREGASSSDASSRLSLWWSIPKSFIARCAPDTSARLFAKLKPAFVGVCDGVGRFFMFDDICVDCSGVWLSV